MDRGFLVLNRTDITDSQLVKSGRLPVLSLSHEEVRQRYRGIEGDPWPECKDMGKIKLEGGLSSLEQHKIVVDYYNIVSKKYLCDFLYIQTLPHLSNVRIPIPHEFTFLGYDYGYYELEDRYSSLYYELIFGFYDEMRHFAKYLNEHLLLPSIDLIKDIEHSRKELVEKGASAIETVEPGEEFSPIAIWDPRIWHA